MKKKPPPEGVGPGDGAKYCWAGTFGSLLKNQGGPWDGLLGSNNVSASLSCDSNNLFYRQCFSEWGRRGALFLSPAAVKNPLARV